MVFCREVTIHPIKRTPDACQAFLTILPLSSAGAPMKNAFIKEQWSPLTSFTDDINTRWAANEAADSAVYRQDSFRLKFSSEKKGFYNEVKLFHFLKTDKGLLKKHWIK